MVFARVSNEQAALRSDYWQRRSGERREDKIPVEFLG
jgi:hypothetical protein